MIGEERGKKREPGTLVHCEREEEREEMREKKKENGKRERERDEGAEDEPGRLEERKKETTSLNQESPHQRGMDDGVRTLCCLLLLVQRTGFTTLRPQVTLSLSLSNSLLSPHLFLLHHSFDHLSPSAQ